MPKKIGDKTLRGGALDKYIRAAVAKGVSRAERLEQRVNYIHGEMMRDGRSPISKEEIRKEILFQD